MADPIDGVVTDLRVRMDAIPRRRSTTVIDFRLSTDDEGAALRAVEIRSTRSVVGSVAEGDTVVLLKYRERHGIYMTRRLRNRSSNCEVSGRKVPFVLSLLWAFYNLSFFAVLSYFVYYTGHPHATKVKPLDVVETFFPWTPLYILWVYRVIRRFAGVGRERLDGVVSLFQARIEPRGGMLRPETIWDVRVDRYDGNDQPLPRAAVELRARKGFFGTLTTGDRISVTGRRIKGGLVIARHGRNLSTSSEFGRA